jgi:histone H3/H4
MSLIVKSNIKEFSDLQISAEFEQELEKKAEELIKKAEERAKKNNRRTLFARDL